LPARGPAAPHPGRTYLITGGLGGIGLALAEYLTRLPAKVVLTGRSAFPPRAGWDAVLRSGQDPAQVDTIRRLLAVEEAGGELLVLRADVTSLTDMQAVVDRAGPISGVIHAAGVVDAAGMIQRRARADTDAVIAAKVRGTLVLDQVLAGQDLDFFVLCSSLGPILYNLKFGEVGYVAGNEFLNAFAAYRTARGHTGTVAISWTDWLEAGMWARAREQLGRYELTGPDTALSIRPADDLLQGITHAEGIRVFGEVLAQGAVPHVVVSTQDLDALLAQHEAFTTTAHRQLVDRLRLPAAAPTEAARTGASATPSEPPATPDEAAIAAMWVDLLGHQDVGALDNFFALGGDSLLALRFLSLLREAFGVEHTIARMFEAPTVREVAQDIARARGAPTERPQDIDGDEEEVLL
jgi:NAD(P)-dependent dehydrogenase (short-subunit alcohol dehydrogenase family)/acyl carrier protein